MSKLIVKSILSLALLCGLTSLTYAESPPSVNINFTNHSDNKLVLLGSRHSQFKGSGYWIKPPSPVLESEETTTGVYQLPNSQYGPVADLNVLYWANEQTFCKIAVTPTGRLSVTGSPKLSCHQEKPDNLSYEVTIEERATTQ